MEIISNTRGGAKLCFEGYMYTKKNSNKTRMRWECANRRAFSCIGAVTTDLQIQEVLSATDHTHYRDDVAIEAAKARISMKENAGITRGRPGQILADALESLPLEVRAAIGNTESVKRSIRRNIRQQKNGDLPKDQATLLKTSPMQPLSEDRNMEVVP